MTSRSITLISTFIHSLILSLASPWSLMFSQALVLSLHRPRLLFLTQYTSNPPRRLRVVYLDFHPHLPQHYSSDNPHGLIAKKGRSNFSPRTLLVLPWAVLGSCVPNPVLWGRAGRYTHTAPQQGTCVIYTHTHPFWRKKWSSQVTMRLWNAAPRCPLQ